MPTTMPLLNLGLGHIGAWYIMGLGHKLTLTLVLGLGHKPTLTLNPALGHKPILSLGLGHKPTLTPNPCVPCFFVHVAVGGKGDRREWGGGGGVCISCLCYSVVFNFNEHHKGKFLVICVRTLRSHILNLNKL